MILERLAPLEPLELLEQSAHNLVAGIRHQPVEDSWVRSTPAPSGSSAGTKSPLHYPETVHTPEVELLQTLCNIHDDVSRMELPHGTAGELPVPTGSNTPEVHGRVHASSSPLPMRSLANN